MADSDLSKLTLSRGPDGLLSEDRRSRWRRRLGWGIAVLLLLGAGAFGAKRIREAPVEIEQATVTTAYPYQSLAALTSTGYVVAQRKAAVASKATGRLEWLGVTEGSRVKRGEVIAKIENADVSAARDQALANLKVARANLEQARVELADARREQGRAAELLRQNFVSQAAYDQAAARTDKARAVLGSLEAAVSVAQANVRAAEVGLEQTLIRAPFDGVVLTKSANVGDNVTPFSAAADTRGAVVTLADMATLEVEADVSESSLAKVRVEQPVEIQLDALPDQRFRGRVSRMVPTVDRAKATVMTKIRFLQLDDRVLPEMSAKVTFLTAEIGEAQRTARTAVVPAAVVRRGAADVAFVVSDGVARQRTVTVGDKLGDLVEIRAGLTSGDKVVVKPGETLADGTRVKPAAK